jgi:DNA-binding NarL/FixJ family response regulator
MDISMPDFNGIDATRQIVSEIPSAKVVALSMHAGKRFVEDMLLDGRNMFATGMFIPMAGGYNIKSDTAASMAEE